MAVSLWIIVAHFHLCSLLDRYTVLEVWAVRRPMHVCCGSQWGRCVLFINIWDSLTAPCLVYNMAMYTVYSRCGHYGRCMFIHWPGVILKADRKTARRHRLADCILCGRAVGYWTTRRYANSRTGRLADWISRGLVNSRTRQLVYWKSRTGQLADAIGDFACLVFVLLAVVLLRFQNVSCRSVSVGFAEKT